MNIKPTFISAALLVLGVLLAPRAHSQNVAPPAADAPRLRLSIAVDQFKCADIKSEWYALPRDVREGIQAALIDKLSASGSFQVMEREALGQINQEADIDRAKRATQDGQDKIKPRDKVTPARFVITPTITGWELTGAKNDTGNFHGFKFGKSKTTLTLTINIRISDAQTSASLDSQTSKAEQTTSGTSFKFEVPHGGFGDADAKKTLLAQVVEKALTEAVGKIVERLKKEPWTALVAAQDPTTGRVIINAGTPAGVAVGMEFDVFKAGGEVRDPNTGDVLTQGDEVKIGRIRVTRVDAKAAYCDVLDGKSFDANNIVRYSH